jgi:oxygen-independent coproporphyrinogen-3 oxidase
MIPPSAFHPPLSLYVHVPVCSSRCAYCDFFSRAAGDYPEGALENLVDATLSRLDGFRSALPGLEAGFETVYIGGGTPTALPLPAFSRLLEGLKARVGSPREWSMEANPESLDEARLEAALGAGVNRLSLGVQSLDDGLLGRLGRRARSADCRRALCLAAAQGGLSVSADLIAGLPRDRPLAEEAGELLDLGVGHLSVYDLSLEEGTVLEAMVASGAFALPGEDEAADERKEAELLLASRGFRRYEVSNYALPGQECRHNLCYWHMDSYLGVGPGAVSTLQALPEGGGGEGGACSLRIEEARDPGREALETPIGLKDAAFEMLMMGFRTIYGLDRAAFEARFGIDAYSLIEKSVAKWRGRLVPAEAWPGRLSRESTGTVLPVSPPSFALDSRGLDLLNAFLVDCLGEIDEELR